MLNKLKNLLNKYKVHVTVVGGVLIVATTLGTCSFEPLSTSDNAASTTSEVAPASSTTGTTTETTGTTETTTETTGTTETTETTTTEAQ